MYLPFSDFLVVFLYTSSQNSSSGLYFEIVGGSFNFQNFSWNLSPSAAVQNETIVVKDPGLVIGPVRTQPNTVSCIISDSKIFFRTPSNRI